MAIEWSVDARLHTFRVNCCSIAKKQFCNLTSQTSESSATGANEKIRSTWAWSQPNIALGFSSTTPLSYFFHFALVIVL